MRHSRTLRHGTENALGHAGYCAKSVIHRLVRRVAVRGMCGQIGSVDHHDTYSAVSIDPRSISIDTTGGHRVRRVRARAAARVRIDTVESDTNPHAHTGQQRPNRPRVRLPGLPHQRNHAQTCRTRRTARRGRIGRGLRRQRFSPAGLGEGAGQHRIREFNAWRIGLHHLSRWAGRNSRKGTSARRHGDRPVRG